MSEFYEKINWKVQFHQYLNPLINIGYPTNSSMNLTVPPPIAYQFIPELSNLNRLLVAKQYKIISISVVNTRAGIFGGIHVDKTQTKRNLELRLNIPLENSTSMINRWYDIGCTPYRTVDWDYQPNFLTDGDRWFLENQQLMVDRHCIGTLVLEDPVFFHSSIPHNVDGRHSAVDRKIVSIVFSNSVKDRIADWCERGEILECINRL